MADLVHNRLQKILNRCVIAWMLIYWKYHTGLCKFILTAQRWPICLINRSCMWAGLTGSFPVVPAWSDLSFQEMDKEPVRSRESGQQKSRAAKSRDSESDSGFQMQGILTPRDTWQYLETVLIVITGGAAGIWWAEARDAADHPAMNRTFPQQRIILPQTSTVPKLRNAEAGCLHLDLTLSRPLDLFWESCPSFPSLSHLIFKRIKSQDLSPSSRVIVKVRLIDACWAFGTLSYCILVMISNDNKDTNNKYKAFLQICWPPRGLQCFSGLQKDCWLKASHRQSENGHALKPGKLSSH